MASITSARPALLPTGYLSLSLAFHDRVHVIMAYFNLGKLTCVSAPHYKSEADYNRPTRLQSQGGTGDWRLDNFLRQSLGDWPGETVETWEARVAELWNIAGDGQSWSDLDLTVDDQEIGGKALIKPRAKCLRSCVAARLRLGGRIATDESCPSPRTAAHDNRRTPAGPRRMASTPTSSEF